MIRVGERAADFTLTGTDGDDVTEFTLSEVAAGRPTMLVFYVYDFSPVCTDQLCEVNDMDLLTINDDAAVLGVSPDGPYSHQRFIEDAGISYPLLTDDDKRVYEQFGMLEETETGRAQRRGIVLLDPERVVRYRWVADDNWDDWEMEHLTAANDLINEMTA